MGRFFDKMKAGWKDNPPMVTWVLTLGYYCPECGGQLEMNTGTHKYRCFKTKEEVAIN